MNEPALKQPLPPQDNEKSLRPSFGLRITDHIAALIRGAPKNDPVAAQYLPQSAELVIAPEEDADPIGDDAHSPVKGIVHRYADRVLYKITNVCAVHCRYCFRKEMIGPGSDSLSESERKAALDYIRTTPSIWEVILTGGDPLVLSPKKLKDTIDALCAIDHVRVIRIHTRIPVADPQRVTPDLIAALNCPKPVYMAVHINHAREITPEVERAFRALHAGGCVLLSQSVLLKGVNDDPAVLEALFRRLIELRVKPYYLHHPDLAHGTSHFRLGIQEGQAIVRRLLSRISGICRPHYMLDIPGGHGKIPLENCYVEALQDGTYSLQDYNDNQHVYPPRRASAP